MELFAGVTQHRVSTSSGGCDLPILYRDGSLLGTFFLVDLARAEPFFEGLSIEPWPLMGRALVSFFTWEYRDSTVGAYGEIGLGIQARRRGSKPSLLKLGANMRKQEDQGIWVVNLPVTTKDAHDAGVEIWGYPKYVTPIVTDFEAGTHARLGDELEIECGPMRGPATPSFPLVCYTEKNGDLIRTVIETGSKVRWDTGGHTRVRVIGDGPTAKSVRALGLDEKKPFSVFRTDRFRATLPAGSPIGPARMG